jgi:MFS family permease
MITLGLLYIAQGIPVYFFTVGVTSILRKEGLSLEWFGLLSALALPWALKFLWASWIDRRGTRRAWIISLQALTTVLLASLTFIQPYQDFWTFFLIGLAIAFVSSTQDIAIDAYAIEHSAMGKRSLVNSLQASGAALGSIIGGTALLFVYERYGWEVTTLSLSAFAVVSFLMVLLTPFGHRDVSPVTPVILSEAKDLRHPERSEGSLPHRPSLRHALRRPKIRRLLLLSGVTRLCEGFVMVVIQPILIDHGVGLETVGLVIGALGAGIGLLSAWMAGASQKIFGENRVFFGGLGFRTLVYGLFAIYVSMGHLTQTGLITFVVATLIARYFIFVPLYSIYMGGTAKSQSGTDFAVLVCGDYLFYFGGSAIGATIAGSFGYPVLFTTAVIGSAIGMIWTRSILRTSSASATEDVPRRVAAEA